MGIANFGAAPTGANCEITTNIPAEGYTAGATYTVTVTSTTALARKLGSSVAGFSASAAIDQSSTKTTSSTHQWTANSDSSASFKALCGAGGAIDQMWVADMVTYSIVAPTSSSASTTTDAGASTSAPTTTDMLTSSTVSQPPGQNTSGTDKAGLCRMILVFISIISFS
jgi:hypothetical protein